MSYARVSILGQFPGGEKWSINPVFDPNGEGLDTVSQANLDAAVAAVNALTIPSALMTLQGSGVTVNGCRIEVRSDTDDRLIGLSTASRATPSGGAGSLKLPTQSAIVVSLRTNTPGGRGRGRLYWPATGVVLGTDGRISSPTPTAIAADMKTYLLAIRNALATTNPLIGFDLAVRSQASRQTPLVVRLQVGDVVDTQRRRRDAYIESYSSVSFPA